MDFLIASFQIKSLSLFEAFMMVCFGISWPFMLRKTIKTKNVKGQSKIFLSIILIGYISGMLHKILYNMDFVFWLYFLNFVLVFSELILVIIYGREFYKKDDLEKNII